MKMFDEWICWILKDQLPPFYRLSPLIGSFLHHHCCKQSACSSTSLTTRYWSRGPTWTVQPAHSERPTQSDTVRQPWDFFTKNSSLITLTNFIGIETELTANFLLRLHPENNSKITLQKSVILRFYIENFILISSLK